jgi:WD40 repeat protein
VYTLQRSSTDTIFFSAAGDGMVVKWDLLQPDEGELVAKLPNSIYSLSYDAHSDLLVVGQNYSGIHLIDWKNKKEVGSLQLTTQSIFDIQSIDGGILVASGDGRLALVDPQHLAVVRETKAYGKSARSISVSEKRNEIAVGYSDHCIRIFDGDLQLKQEWQAHSNSVFTVRYMPDQTTLISGSRDARLKVWDALSGYGQVGEVVAHMYAINYIDFSPDGKHFVTCSMDKSIKVWDVGQLKLLKVIDRARHAGHGTSVNKVLWIPYQDLVISASDDRTVSVWKLNFFENQLI